MDGLPSSYPQILENIRVENDFFIHAKIVLGPIMRVHVKLHDFCNVCKQLVNDRKIYVFAEKRIN